MRRHVDGASDVGEVSSRARSVLGARSVGEIEVQRLDRGIQHGILAAQGREPFGLRKHASIELRHTTPNPQARSVDRTCAKG